MGLYVIYSNVLCHHLCRFKCYDAPPWQMKGRVVLHWTSFHLPVWFTITTVQLWSLSVGFSRLKFQKRNEMLLWSDHDQKSLNSPIHTSPTVLFVQVLTLAKSVWNVLQYSWASLQELFFSIRIYFLLATDKQKAKVKNGT